MLNLSTTLKPSLDQKKAIDKLTNNLKNKINHQVLLGATGTGKTFTIANVINNVQKKTIIIVNNKTLASQLYGEFKTLFPNNHVEYFISYFDFYTPEAYIPSTMTYIEKSSKINKEIEMLRLSTINSLANYDDVIVVASVAAIFASSDPNEVNKSRIIITVGQKMSIKSLLYSLAKLQYKRNEIEYAPGNFFHKGDTIFITPSYSDQYYYRISFFGNEIEDITIMDITTHKKIKTTKICEIIPATEYVLNDDTRQETFTNIRNEMEQRIKYFQDNKKLIEAQRIKERTEHDIEQMTQIGYCSGIENYSMHLENRKHGQMPYTIFDYLKNDDWLLVVDESHMTIPQIGGIYHGDRSRKQTLVDYGYRLPSALDNRPLKFDEFTTKIKNAIYVSATPMEWEINKSKNCVVEQIIRPTGLLDPTIEIHKLANQLDDLLSEINKEIKNKGRVFVTVLTIKIAEELTDYLIGNNIKCFYMHSKIKTLDRNIIINDLRRGKYDVIVGINLLREGLDVPEVSMVAILDADKEGLFRNERSLIQTFGRAARNENGRIILYADTITDSMKKAINETNRRRAIQIAHNKKYEITPKTIKKPITNDLKTKEDIKILETFYNKKTNDASKVIKMLNKEMIIAAKNKEYERAANIRDMIIELESKE